MFESLFGAEMPLPVRFFIAFLIVLGLIGVTAWVVRRFGGERLDAMTRGRQPRLAVIDAAQVDGRRRLILIRRDNIEHLLMIGGPTDIVIEPNIVRAVAAGREAPVPQRAPAADTLPRAVQHGEATAWPPQAEAAQRAARAAPVEESEPWTQEAEPQPVTPPLRRPARTASDQLSGIAAEVTRFPEPRTTMPEGPSGGFGPRDGRQREAARERDESEPPRERETIRERAGGRLREASLREPARQQREQPQREPSMQEPAEPVRERPAREREGARMRELQSAPPEDFDTDADQNLADMAQRLEAALRRPGKGEARSAEPRAAEPRVASDAADTAMSAELEATPPLAPRPAPAEAKPGKSLYDSLEKEMASLLGRPSGKS
jgi:flagellar protein FliO/FliZ